MLKSEWTTLERLVFLCRLTDAAPALHTRGKCYNELPVTVQTNEGPVDMFVKPVTRILTTVPTIVLCSEKLPVKFFLDRSTAICQGSAGLFLCNQFTIIDAAKGLQKANLETLTEEESRTGTTSLLSEIIVSF